MADILDIIKEMELDDTYNYNYSTRGTGASLSLTKSERETLMKAIIANGGPLTDAQLLELKLINKGGNHAGSNRFKNVKAAMNQFIDLNATKLGFDSQGNEYSEEGTPTAPGLQGTDAENDPRLAAFNAYWNDMYSLEKGTGGADMLNRLEGAYGRQANADLTMANVQFQQGAMAQARTVKQIADQVRAERMARLRSGMSEAQIANQDMQQMMANVNALNENAAMLGTQRTQARLNQGLVQDQAYMEYMNQMNQRGQVGAGMAASDAGSAYQAALQYATLTPEQKKAYEAVVNPTTK